jgi:hypothetical protein
MYIYHGAKGGRRGVEGEWDLGLFYCLILHCKENPIYVFFFWELRGLSPNFHIHVSVSDLYITL